MLPGKTYTPDDVLRIARRRAWVVLLPTALIGAAAAVWTRTLPNLYRSESVIQVEPQRVPESYVRSTVTTRIEDRLPALTQRILSRARLESIITEFDLYAEQRKKGLMEDVVERMRRDIRPEITRTDAFRISYTSRDPRVAKAVTERLVSHFIDENTRERSRMADNASGFIERKLEETRRQLIEQEKRLEAYRRQHAGELPEQLEANLQFLENANQRLRQNSEDINRLRFERQRLARDIADLAQRLEEAARAAAAGVPVTADNSPARELAAARAELAELLRTKREEHYQVQRQRALIRDLEARAAAAAAARPQEATPISPDYSRLSPEDAKLAGRLDDMRLQLDQLDKRLGSLESEQERLHRDIALYEARNEAIPTRETELIELKRDYATIYEIYTGLLKKHEDSRIAADMERDQIGEKFTMIEAPRVPQRPFSPDRKRLTVMGLGAGLLLGLLLVALLEYRDRTFATDDDVTRVLTLPVLAVVPLMQSAAERRQARRRAVLMNLGFGTTTLACLAIVAYTIVR